jgi:hypothetical protein
MTTLSLFNNSKPGKRRSIPAPKTIDLIFTMVLFDEDPVTVGLSEAHLHADC